MAKWPRKKTPTPNDSDKCARSTEILTPSTEREREGKGGKGPNLGHSYFWKKTSVVTLTGTFLSGSPANAHTHTHN